MAKRLLVVGSINLDLVVQAERIPVAGETLIGMTFRTFPGGKGANQAFAAARLGAAVSMIGRLGNDAFGAELRASLNAAGVDTSAIEVVATSSGVAQITTAANGDNSIVVVPGANYHLAPRDLEESIDLIRGSGMILTQLEIPLDTVECLARIARKENIPLILDPAPARSLPSTLLKSVDWITPNETETRTLLQLPVLELSSPAIEDAASTLLRDGCRNVLLKLGSRGCYVALSSGLRRMLPAYSVRAIDTTAAGDAFNGAFAVALLRGQDPVAGASWASAVAAISVTRPGAQSSMPTGREVEVFLAENTVPGAS